MKKTIHLLLVLSAVFASSVHAEQGQNQKSTTDVDKTKLEASQEQGEKALEAIKNNVDGCSGTDLLDGHGGIDCSSVKVFDFDDRSPLPMPQK